MDVSSLFPSSSPSKVFQALFSYRVLRLVERQRQTHTDRHISSRLSISSRLTGIESNLFLLILHPPELQGSKPFDPMYTFKDLIGFGLGICLFRLKVKILWQLVETCFLLIFQGAFVFC